MSSHYAQYCPVARVAEIVAERWTVLIARELLLGARRFADLLDGLPGISTSVLTSRLRDLEGAGLVAHRRLPAPAASLVYELTSDAAGLVGVLAAMGEWGTSLLGQPRPDDSLRSAWLVLGLAVSGGPRRIGDAMFELRIIGDLGADGGVFHVESRSGHLAPRHGAAASADAVITMSASLLRRLATRGDDAAMANDPAIHIDGDADAGRRFVAALVTRPS